MTTTLKFALDVFAVFNGRLSLSGWIVDTAPIAAVELRSTGISGGRHGLSSYGVIDSPDVAEQHGAAAARVRFSETFEFDATRESLSDAYLSILYADGRSVEIGNLVGRQPNPAGALISRFTALLRDVPRGHLLEVGSRARSGIVRRDMVPETWLYTGLDVLAGPNVDIVGDVHEISTLFKANSFQAVMAFSVLEHLLMPWKAVIELNRVLALDAIGVFTTHQCWPVHDQPWDFWRFSDRAWDGLLNQATGFEIIEAAMSEPAYVVAQRCHPVTNFGLQQSGFLASNVLFRKIGPTKLQWPVAIGDAISTRYPEGNVS